MRKIALVLVFWASHLIILGQTNPMLEMALLSLQKIDTLFVQSTGLNIERFTLGDSVRNLDYKSETITWVANLKRAYSTHTGVEVKMGYDKRFGFDFIDDSMDDLMTYSHRVQTEISWNILRSGFVGRQVMADKAELLGERKLLTSSLANLNLAAKGFASEQNDLINAHLNYILEQKLGLLNSLLLLNEHLRSRDKIYEEEVIALKYEISLLKGEFKHTRKKVSHLIDGVSYLAQQDSISLSEIDSLVKQTHRLKQNDIDNELISNELRQISYLKEMGITPFMRCQYYSMNSQNDQHRLGGSAGLSVSLPIKPELSAQRKEIKSREILAKYDRVLIEEELSFELSSIINGLNTNLDALYSCAEAEHYYFQRIIENKKLFLANKITIQDLYKEYIKLLDCHLRMCNLIGKRQAALLELAVVSQAAG